MRDGLKHLACVLLMVTATACSSGRSRSADVPSAERHTGVLQTAPDAGRAGAAGAYASVGAGVPVTVVQSQEEDAGLPVSPPNPPSPAGSPGPASPRRWKPPSTPNV